MAVDKEQAPIGARAATLPRNPRMGGEALQTKLSLRKRKVAQDFWVSVL